MVVEHKHKGARSELLACVWLLEQGYEVFRNVSACGPMDLIAIKDGVTLFLDVKTRDEYPGATSISQDQAARGVGLLIVTNGQCRIDMRPPVKGTKNEGKCAECGAAFVSRGKRKHQRFCTAKCNHTHWKRERELRNQKLPIGPITATQNT
jgi:hypothetical protein